MKKRLVKKDIVIILVLTGLFLVVGIGFLWKKTPLTKPGFTVEVISTSINISDFSREYEKIISPSKNRFAVVFNEDHYGIAVFTNTEQVGVAYICTGFPFRPIYILKWIDEATIEYEIAMAPSHGVLIRLDLSKQEVIKAVPRKR